MKVRALPAALVAACVAVSVAGCTGSSDPHRSASKSQASQPSDESAATAVLQRQAAERLAAALAPRRATTTLRPALDYARAGDGSTLVLVGSSWRKERTTYRVYDSTWRPLTPLLEVSAMLSLERGLQDGFLVTASRTGGPRKRLSAVATMATDGALTPALAAADALVLRRTDILFNSPGGAGAVQAYRPSTREVWRPARNASAPPGRMDWQIDPAGRVCDHPYLLDNTVPTYASQDGGHTWRTIRLARVLPRSARREVQPCYLVKGRLIVGVGEVESVDNLYVVDLETTSGRPQTISSSYVKDLIGYFPFDVLPDGRAVFRGRAGVLVATDPSNTSFRLHELEAPRNAATNVVEGDIVVPMQPASAALALSRDAGRTWRQVSLLGPTPQEP